jgi:site-specific recombinase XerD
MIHLKSVLTFAYSNHLLPDNPSNYIAIKVDRRHQLRQFSEDECKMLLMSFDSVYLRNLYRFVYFSGISIRESAALHLSDYHPDSRTLDVSHVLNYRQNKDVYIGPNKMPRQIIIPSEAAVCIEDELENRAQKSIAEEASNLIFTERSGNIINMRNFIYCNGVIKKKSAVNDFRPLYLRDNFLLRCLNEGVDDRSLERYLGICSNTYMLYIQNLFQPIRRPGIDIYS